MSNLSKALNESEISNPIIGGAEVNDIDTIIDISRANSDVTSVIHAVQDNSDALFTWDYAKGAGPLLSRRGGYLSHFVGLPKRGRR